MQVFLLVPSGHIIGSEDERINEYGRTTQLSAAGDSSARCMRRVGGEIQKLHMSTLEHRPINSSCTCTYLTTQVDEVNSCLEPT